LFSGRSGGGTAYAYVVPLVVINALFTVTTDLIGFGRRDSAVLCSTISYIFGRLFIHVLFTHLYGIIQKQKMARCDVIAVFIT
jgi:hypothetical protein